MNTDNIDVLKEEEIRRTHALFMNGGIDEFSLQYANWNVLDAVASPITNPEMIDQKTLTPTIGGILDPSIVGKSTPYDDYYSCDCTNPEMAMTGKINEGHLCPNCGTTVQKVHNTNTKYGYISLGNSYILSPLGFILVKTMLGSDPEKVSKHQSNHIIDRIIDLPPTNDKNGYSQREYSLKSPFRGIGLVEFRAQFLDIIKFYKEKIFKNPANIARYNQVMALYRDNALFVNKIYVAPINTRPVVPIYKEKQIKSHPITLAYDTINKLAEKIRTTEAEESDFTTSRVRTMEVLQQKIYELGVDAIKTGIVGKTGIPRKNVLGGRMDNSARYVIIPLAATMPTLMNQIFLPYSAFICIFSIQIAYHYIVRQNQFVNEYLISNIKSEIENSAYTLNLELYDIALDLIKKDHIKTAIGRNPTNCRGSIQTCDVAYVGWNPIDTCMRISNNILLAPNADFDGDHMYEQKEQTYSIEAYIEGASPNMLIASPQGKTFIEGKSNILYKDMIPALDYATQNIGMISEEERRIYEYR